ncbi:MAG: tetratricopeptide repeat protein [Vicinamibacterales bacterium]
MARLLGWPLAGAVTLAAAVTAVLAVVSVRTEREHARLVAAGDEALAAADLGGAIEAYTGAITLNPDSTAAHLKRGLAYRQRRELDAALRDLRLASELDPTSPRIFEWQGDVLLELGRYARAAERFERSVALDDRQPDVHYKLAVARYREGRAGTAVDPLQRAVALAPGHAQAHYLLGVCLRDLGRLDEAASALDAAARLAPASSPCVKHEPTCSRHAGRPRAPWTNSTRWPPSSPIARNARWPPRWCIRAEAGTTRRSSRWGGPRSGFPRRPSSTRRSAGCGPDSPTTAIRWPSTRRSWP